MRSFKTPFFCFLLIFVFSFGCCPENKNYDTNNATISEYLEYIRNYENESEVFVFGDASVTDSLIPEISNLKNSFFPSLRTDRIFTAGKHLPFDEGYDWVFFRKCRSGKGIHLCFLNRYDYVEDLYTLEQFELGGDDSVVTVFARKEDNPENSAHSMLIVISKDAENHYYTDMFRESCGNQSCHMYNVSLYDTAIYSAFAGVRRYEDFEPVYLKYTGEGK